MERKVSNDDKNIMKDDMFFMKEALKEAKKAYNKNEVPVGVVLVKNGEVV